MTGFERISVEELFREPANNSQWEETVKAFESAHLQVLIYNEPSINFYCLGLHSCPLYKYTVFTMKIKTKGKT